MSMLEPALWWASRGTPVFPCHEKDDVDHKAKGPRTKHGFKDATIDEDQIREWWTRWPNAAIGVPTGEPSGFFVLDVDTKDGKLGQESLRELQLANDDLPDTRTVRTWSGGFHHLFKYPGHSIHCSASALAPGLDIRGDGGYVIVPPSLVAENGADPQPYATVDKEAGIVGAPQWLLDKLKAPKSAPRGSGNGEGKITEGRNCHLASLAGSMRHRGMGEAALAAALMAENDERCDPPLGEDEVRKIAHSYAGYDPGDSAQRPRAQNRGGNGPGRQWVPPEESQGPVERCRFVTMSDVQAKDVEWLWGLRVALGTVTVSAGEVSLGKTLVSCAIAAAVSRPGFKLPFGSEPIHGDVILLTAEDNLQNTIKPRLDAAGADASRIHAIQSIDTFHPESGEATGMRMPDLQRDLAHIEWMLDQFPHTVLVWIDPITAYYGSKVDSHNTSDLRGLLHPIQDMAERRNIAVLAQTHFNKNKAQGAVDRVTGSGALVQASRAAFVFARDKDNPERIFMLWSKSNLGPQPDGLAFSIGVVPVAGLDSLQPVVQWESLPVTMSADDALAPPPADQPERDNAKAFLETELVGGCEKVADLQKAAKQAGVSWRTMERAKAELGVTSKKRAFDGQWEWCPSWVEDRQDQVRQGGVVSENRGGLGGLGQEVTKSNEDRQHRQGSVRGPLGGGLGEAEPKDDQGDHQGTPTQNRDHLGDPVITFATEPPTDAPKMITEAEDDRDCVRGPLRDHLAPSKTRTNPIKGCEDCRNWTGDPRCLKGHVAQRLGSIPTSCPDFTPHS